MSDKQLSATHAADMDAIKLANELIASYLKDSADALENAKEVARQTGIPFKFDVSGLLVAFDPAVEKAELETAAQAKEDEYWCSSDEEWDNSGC